MVYLYFILFHVAICAHDAPTRYCYHPSDVTISTTYRSHIGQITGDQHLSASLHAMPPEASAQAVFEMFHQDYVRFSCVLAARSV